jgi:hypothetical protein
MTTIELRRALFLLGANGIGEEKERRRLRSGKRLLPFPVLGGCQPTDRNQVWCASITYIPIE